MDNNIIKKIIERAIKLEICKDRDRISHLMDIEIATKCFDIDLKEWFESDDMNFAHDFIGIYNNINRKKVQEHMLKNEEINKELCEKENIFNSFCPRYSK